jgi:hypothetical protein
VGGQVYQFAEGLWPGPLGNGVVMTEEAYDFIEPYLDKCCPDVSGPARYGTTELPRATMAKKLHPPARARTSEGRISVASGWPSFDRSAG